LKNQLSQNDSVKTTGTVSHAHARQCGVTRCRLNGAGISGSRIITCDQLPQQQQQQQLE